MEVPLPISGSTRLYGLIGRSIKNSRSPLIHNTAFFHNHIQSVYIPLQTSDRIEDQQSLGTVLHTLCTLGFSGLNVTMPYKEAALPFVSVHDPAVMGTGALNTIRISDGIMYGYNTDVYGINESLRQAGVSVRGASVAIIGAGGVARAAGYALDSQGAKNISIVARNPQKAASTAASLKAGVLNNAAFAHEDLTNINADSLQKYDMIVNATPVGMNGYPAAFSYKKWYFRTDQVYFDLVYYPWETSMMKEAYDAGAHVIGGLNMLIYQAIKSFEIWTGITPSFSLIKTTVMDQQGTDA